MTVSKHFNIFIIGAGSGGVRAARLASNLGAKVGIAEEFRFGGTCVIRGCVPKKLLVYASEFSDHFSDSLGFGWEKNKSSLDWQKLIGAKDNEIDRLESIYLKNLEKSGVTIYNARAHLCGEKTVRLSNSDTITAETILIATGGRPYVPAFPGNELVLTSNEVFDIKEKPDKILIVGGGYIACEFATIFNGLGSKVVQLYRGEQILRGFDSEVRNHLSHSLIERGVEIIVNGEVLSCKKLQGRIEVKFSNAEIDLFDSVLFATGRHPNTEGLGLEDVGVKLDTNKAIIVDEFQQTSVEKIYAIGDVTNRKNLTPVAIRDAIAFVETVLKENPTRPDHELVPTAVFSKPEIGTVGLTEMEAAKSQAIKVYKTLFRPMFNVISGRDEKTLMKLIVNSNTEKILGCHIVGPNAAEMIQLLAVAVKMGATKGDLDRTCAVHPTLAEEIVTLN